MAYIRAASSQSTEAGVVRSDDRTWISREGSHPLSTNETSPCRPIDSSTPTASPHATFATLGALSTFVPLPAIVDGQADPPAQNPTILPCSTSAAVCRLSSVVKRSADRGTSPSEASRCSRPATTQAPAQYSSASDSCDESDAGYSGSSPPSKKRKLGPSLSRLPESILQRRSSKRKAEAMASATSYLRSGRSH
jgi:hypothetical protein